MRSLLVIVILAGLLSACKNNNKNTGSINDTGTATTTSTSAHEAKGWDAKTRADFVANCTNESKTRMHEEEARTYCNCMLEKIAAKYPSPAEANNMTLQETQNMARECVK